eukprot:CAMPEP_0184496494 /NCGR_PEP_ID=MMETSP0113_2-20130426/34095_1 /TAXON_ID=91329 /ORGANISM="Norrisiella sphaerica, Strain BC52" /LENGTH=126 /DNA_ID=CAMNT_0026883137 /DNA_START=1 /DNA_END=382 /DNA_ORIENTATION=+
MQPILEDIAANGMAGMMKHMSNPVLMQKLQGVMGGLMAGMGGGGAMGANQEADPYADAEDLNSAPTLTENRENTSSSYQKDLPLKTPPPSKEAKERLCLEFFSSPGETKKKNNAMNEGRCKKEGRG